MPLKPPLWAASCEPQCRNFPADSHPPNGFAFADTLTGNDGNNRLDGGAGIDRAIYAASNAGVSVDLATGTGRGGHAQGDVLSGIENLTGSDFDDTLAGDDGNNRLDGGAGIDWATYAASDAGVSVNPGAGTARGGHAQGDVLTGIENLVGTDFDDTLAGDDDNNRLEGDEGNDDIFAGDGNDYVEGGEGNDEIYGGNGNDSLWGGDGNDSLWGGSENDTIFAGNGDDILSGREGDDEHWLGAGNDRGFGFTGDETLYGLAGDDDLWGGDGNDLLDGGTGNDTIWAGTGNDEVFDTVGDAFVGFDLDRMGGAPVVVLLRIAQRLVQIVGQNMAGNTDDLHGFSPPKTTVLRARVIRFSTM